MKSSKFEAKHGSLVDRNEISVLVEITRKGDWLIEGSGGVDIKGVRK